MKAKLVSENINFTRGKDPKAALDIGSWRKGYVIDKELGGEILSRYNRIPFGKEFNFDKYPSLAEMPKTRVTSAMKKLLDSLPVVTFKYYKNRGDYVGFYGDWPEDFELRNTPFLAKVISDDERTFLIEPEGYAYPRYITELI
jgi:hypothetical protein